MLAPKVVAIRQTANESFIISMRRIVIALTILLQHFICSGQLKPAQIFSDNMVQRM